MTRSIVGLLSSAWLKTLARDLTNRPSCDGRRRRRRLRGEIRWADLHPVRGREQAGERPVLVLSHDVFDERSGTVIVLARVGLSFSGL